MSTRRASDASRARPVALCSAWVLTAVAAGAAPAAQAAAPKVHKCTPTTGSAPPPSSPLRPAVDEGSLTQLPGRYEFLPDLLMIVTREGDQLFARLGEDTAQMLPLADGGFFIKEADLQLSVQRGPDGQATCLVAWRGADSKPMPKVE